ncbi:CAP domain-containing protein [Dictyobacter arantiisoli]|uniref:SCP domain-containing protein n=1 Tax=Dictyobacter arantiisoli TaxID=2014874 RepID=A0A5A5TBP1_9CHLR|nr:CAP domain-containing protein [Dictyobacter arantiisoli]GCF08910.1 hypothetical protein KDI_24740 [Dictyobacter arantiisoli]
MFKKPYSIVQSLLIGMLLLLLVACGSTRDQSIQARQDQSPHLTARSTAVQGGATLIGAKLGVRSIKATGALPPLPPKPDKVIPTPIPTPIPTVVIIPTTIPVPSSGAGTGSSSSALQAAQAVFMEINQQRANAGLPAFQWSNILALGALRHNQAMAATNTLAHQLPGEADPGTRIRQEDINWTGFGENIGIGRGNPQLAVLGLNEAMFGERPPDDFHRRNILSSNTMIGVDVLVDTVHARVWLTEDFAK